MSTYASQSMGLRGLQKFCGLMDMPTPITKKPFNVIQKNISEILVANAEDAMKEAADRTISFALEDNPDEGIEISSSGDLIGRIALSVDGTWQKRGHSSKTVIVFAMSVDTGEVLDYQVKTLHCRECISHQNDVKSSEEYLKWQERHSSKCDVNHEGSSEKMEKQGAVDIFLRSIQTRKLKYTIFGGDGDSASFGSVKDTSSDMYGDTYIVQKGECVGHIQKRMCIALRELKRKHKGMKLHDGKKIGGKGRLTDVIIDKIQNYYGQAITDNNSLVYMQNAIWAIYHHMISPEDDVNLSVQHQFCQKDSWCRYWDDNSNYSEASRLPSVFNLILIPIFSRLSNEDILGRCLKGTKPKRGNKWVAMVSLPKNKILWTFESPFSWS